MQRVLVGSAWLSSIPALVFLLSATPAVGQVTGQSPVTESSATYTLFGTVVNSVTGAPIKHALIEIHVRDRRLAFSDGNGQFEFDNLPAVETAVNVRKPGFFTEREILGGPDPPLLTQIGPDAGPLNISLVPQSAITGHIQSADEEPLEGIPVKAIRARIEDGRKRWVQASAGATNEDGEFRLANLPPGTYYLEVGPSSGFGDLGPEAEGYPARFYPGVAEMSSATPFEIAAGQQVTADVSLHPVPLFKVSGRFTAYAGGGVGVTFIDHLGNSFSFLTRLNSSTGEFQAEVPAGSYILQATEWTPDAGPRQAEIPLNVSSAVSGIAVALGTTDPIPVVVRTENTKQEPVSTAPPLNVHLFRSGDHVEDSDTWSSFQGAPNPSLVIADAEPGTYSVDFDLDSSWYVQSAQCGTTDLLREPLTINAGAQTPAIEVVLRNDGASLTGQIGNRQTHDSATVLLVPDDRSTAQIKAIHTGPDGHFAAGDLAPGTYSALAIDGAGELEYRNRQVLEQYLSRATRVTLDPNGRQTIHLDLLNRAK